MAIGLKDLNGCVNASINTATDSLDLLQLSSVSKDYDAGFVYSVANTASLPAAADNKGRMVYVIDKCGYRVSDGTTWTNDFTSIASTQIWGAGCNSCGAIGDNTITNRSSLVSVVGGFTDWCQVSSSGLTTFGLRTNGTLWGWGCGFEGKIGDGNASSRSSPVSVVGGFTNWCQVSVGAASVHAVRCDGTLWGWGENTYGTIGNNIGDFTCLVSPVSVVGGFTDWCQVSAGLRNTLALRSNGTLWSWGDNISGALGDGTIINRSSPVTVVGGFTDWCQVNASGYSSIGLRSNGSLWSWGCNVWGQLGTGNQINYSSPVSVIGGFTDWCRIAQGISTSVLATRSNGTLWGWGRNYFGMLGIGSCCRRSSPVSVVGGFTDWCQVSVNFRTAAGIRTDGSMWGWGSSYGQFGFICTSLSPVSVAGGLNNWRQVAVGTRSLTAIRSCRGF